MPSRELKSRIVLQALVQQQLVQQFGPTTAGPTIWSNNSWSKYLVQQQLVQKFGPTTAGPKKLEKVMVGKISMVRPAGMGVGTFARSPLDKNNESNTVGVSIVEVRA